MFDNTLILGDCLTKMPEIKENSIDLILADLPYGKTRCKWDVIIPFDLLWAQYKRLIKNNGAIILTSTQPFTSMLIMSNLKWFKYSWIWVKNKKTGFLNAKKQPLRQTEEIVVFYKNQPVFNPQKTGGHKPVNSFTKHSSDGETLGKTKIGIKGGGQIDRFPSNIIKLPVVNNCDKNRVHPTQKPLALMEYFIKTYTNMGDTVLDNAMGSGTTGVACKNLNRNFIGIEVDEKYFCTAKKRIDDLT